ncbi:hypothetical protein DdX_07982 [Ditylenchus destructor]|uniref:NADAR domain-containing protein n=1 Tax=Ditylenchus destructor TaxID=166010 RepID=A0AAD4R7R3_9BILA|nr:hypothetical protein DdX_07982 [Ditylenchus destructor]
MEEGKIVLVGNETDILHCGFSFPLSEGGKRYPSADHYAHSMILSQLGLDEVHILDLLATSSSEVPLYARKLLEENMPAGHDMNSLAQYLHTSRQSYTMLGLRLRAEQDKRFRQSLMETNDALLIVCDRRDNELGVGMDEEEFVAYARRYHANAEKISQWMHDERARPREVGQNQLGFFLMWLRYEIKEKERSKWLTTNEVTACGISTDQDDKPIEISVSDFVIALQGIFQPLSNYYAMNFEIKGDNYRSVEHYAYQRLFESLKLSYPDVMKIRTTVKPVEVSKAAKRIFKTLNMDQAELEHRVAKLDRWRQSAMKHKISKNEYLQKLLLSTGHAILIETAPEGDPQWSICTDEFEIQHLITKKYVTPQVLIDWMCGRAEVPLAVSHLGGNKTGLLLMELRTKFASNVTHRIPLVAPLTSNVIRSGVSNHMICFTPESVLHPFYPVKVRLTPDAEPLPSPVHIVAQAAIRFLNIKPEDAEWIMEAELGPECWHRLHYTITEHLMLPSEKIQQWYMDERQKALKYAMQHQFEQNPSLLRILLDTTDALLISCARFSSTEAELNIGMRERDLRLWLSQVRTDSKSLIDLCVRPMAFRPPYFGGNRLGLILMELRRDFILKGIFPQQLPEMTITVDATLGSDSPMENYVPHQEFDVLSPFNYNALWANPFLLMAKQQTEENQAEMWAKAISQKSAPMLLSAEEPLLNEMFEELLGISKITREERTQPADLVQDLAPEVSKAVFFKLSAFLRTRLTDDEETQRLISKKSRESNRMQEIRRAVERSREHLTRDKSQPVQPSDSAHHRLPQQTVKANSPPRAQPSRPFSGSKTSNSAAPPDPGPMAGGKIPSLLSDITPSRFEKNDNQQNRYVSGDRNRYGDNRWNRGRQQQGQMQNRRRSPSPGYRRRAPQRVAGGPISPPRSSAPPVEQPPSSKPSAQAPEKVKNEQPPAPKKPKRVVDESELSEGEILSDEDE